MNAAYRMHQGDNHLVGSSASNFVVRTTTLPAAQKTSLSAASVQTPPAPKPEPKPADNPPAPTQDPAPAVDPAPSQAVDPNATDGDPSQAVDPTDP
jgi:hypothetical protein